MPYPTPPHGHRRRGLLAVGVAAVLLVIAAVTCAVVVHRSHSSDARATHRQLPVDPGAVVESEPAATVVPTVRPTRDPVSFARQVARAAFEWDTATMVRRADHVELLVGVADPTGDSTAGLVSDLDNYLPAPDAWADLARYQTRQWLAIDLVTTPTTWAQAQAQAGHELLPGTTARTIHGTRHRAGVWDGEPVASAHEVAFTVFIVCGPSYPECHLLRLSMLDKPLA